MNYSSARSRSFPSWLPASKIAPGFAHLGSILSAAALLLSAALAVGCGPASSGGKSGSGGKCFIPPQGAPGESEPLESVKYPTSQIWVLADIPDSAVSEILNREIPFTLASENKRDVGAPGYATYRVTRGTPTIHSTDSGLEVRVPVNADISVCKKIGSACIQYGSCKPAFLARFSLSPEIRDNFQLAAPKGTISATKRCVIGIDVTSPIEEIAKTEVAKVEAEIKKQWPRIQPEVEAGWHEMRHPIPFAEGSCLHLHPNKIFYQTAHLKGTEAGQRLKGAVGLSGTIQPAPDCEEKRDALPLPKPTTKEKAAKRSRLWVPEVVSHTVAQEEFTKSLTGALGSDAEVKVIEVRLEAQRVFLHLETNGSVCGTFWLEGKLSHVAGSDALQLKELKVLGADSPAEMTDILTRLEAKAKVSLRSASWFTSEATQPLEALLRAAVPDQVQFDIKNLKAGDARVLTARDGIYVLHPLTAQLVVTDF